MDLLTLSLFFEEVSKVSGSLEKLMLFLKRITKETLLFNFSSSFKDSIFSLNLSEKTIPFYKFKQPLKTKVISCEEVLFFFKMLKEEKGKGSLLKKKKKILEFLETLSSEQEKKLIHKLILSSSPTGLSFNFLTYLLYFYITKEQPSLKPKTGAFFYKIKKKLSQILDLEVFLEEFFKKGASLFEETLALFTPIRAMLCSSEKLEKFNSSKEKEDFFCEKKLDGIRIQLHVSSRLRSFELYTRNLFRVTHLFPEFKLTFEGFTQAEEFILDGELVAINEKGAPLFFERINERAGIKKTSSIKHGLEFRYYVYDLLVHNGRSLLTEPLTLRKKILKQLRLNKPLILLPFFSVKKPLSIDELLPFEEGFVLKKKDSFYLPGSRTRNWRKIKKEEETNILDLPIIELYKKKKLQNKKATLGACLVGIKREGKIVPLCRVGSGLHSKKIETGLKNITGYSSFFESSPEKSVFGLLKQNVFLKIKYTSISKNKKGLFSLRFPRVIGFRKDLHLEETPSLSILEEKFLKKD